MPDWWVEYRQGRKWVAASFIVNAPDLAEATRMAEFTLDATVRVTERQPNE